MSQQRSGDTFTNISNSTIINRSTLVNAMNAAGRAGHEDAKEALGRIAELVTKSDNPEASELFNSFTEELQKPQPKKSLLRATWDGLLKVLPAIAGVSGAVAAVAKLVS